jgi:hypothetical protein
MSIARAARNGLAAGCPHCPAALLTQVFEVLNDNSVVPEKQRMASAAWARHVGGGWACSACRQR